MKEKLIKLEDVTEVSRYANERFVAKVDGMGLSQNDFSDEYVEKINALEVQIEDILGLQILLDEVIG